MRAAGEEDHDDGRARWHRLVYGEGLPSVLVVSDGADWSHAVVPLLEADGEGVLLDATAEAVDRRHLPFDLAVVDLALAAAAPLDVVGSLRARSGLPILVVAAPAGGGPSGAADVMPIEALLAGADQFAPRDRLHELVARVRALLRRSPPRRRHDVIDLAGAAPPIHLDPVATHATVGGRPVELTEREALLLALLLERPGRVVARAALTAPRRGGHADRSVDALVRTLRAKLDAAGSGRRIVAVRGVGFRLEHVPVAAAEQVPMA